jgi:hypothetical protein
MSTGATIGIVAGVVGVGAVAFLLLRPPAVVTAGVVKAAPKGASAGSLIASLGGALVSRLGGEALDSLGSSISGWLS